MKTLPAWLALLVLAGCGDKPADVFPGYAEAEYVRLAAPIAGTLGKLHVQRGDQVQANAPAFVLEQDSERAAREEAVSRVQRAEAQLANLQKGRRPEEVAAVQAQLAQAEASLQLSRSNYARQKQLVEDKFIAPARLDEARSAVERDQAHVGELRAQVRVAKLGARPDEIAAAGQELKAAQAQLAQAEWRLAQKTQRIPVAGSVADVLYREGEFVQAGSPVVSVLPPQNIKLRFFVPETQFAALKLGQDVSVQCDGCGGAIEAKVSYLSSAPEYTSPLIYSKENRAALVFMIEARPAPGKAALLHPGQPVEIRFAQAR
ncbi:HlyD family secretion protein [Noviherbaspirillum denitrificans]|uniref:Secretion protein HlyD n=1 Tax=Noviherbaspirillum denitrificans TaxID=1968433 RepID=A0A254TPR8_9BURK|nr:HlyD family efflux transporter periplasmic adaptor subunit [Noviherbaspirillum denitrificans]OWW22643.1 secretion protein HlyD [Noviherbaspirillum denitrificans]